MTAGEILQSYDLSGGRVTVESKGLLRVVLKEHEQITAAHIREMHEITIQEIKQKLPILIDQRKIKRMDREAREVAASDYIAEFTERLAVLMGPSPLSIVIGNFFLRVTRPPYPTRLFETEPEALAWLLDDDQSP